MSWSDHAVGELITAAKWNDLVTANTIWYHGGLTAQPSFIPAVALDPGYGGIALEPEKSRVRSRRKYRRVVKPMRPQRASSWCPRSRAGGAAGTG